MTNPAEEEFSLSEVTEKGGEEVQHAHTVTPVKQVPLDFDKEPELTVDLHEPVTPPPEHEDHLSTEDSPELIKKVSYHESYQPAPDGNPDTDHEEPHVPPTIPLHAEGVETVTEDSTLPTTDAKPPEISEHHFPVTESPDSSGFNSTSGADADELLSSSPEVPHESDLPVLQEDHTPDVHPETSTVTELVHSSASSDVSWRLSESSSGPDEEMTTSPDAEDADVHSTTLLPSSDSSTPENLQTEEHSGEESPSPGPDEEVTQSLVAMETSATSEPSDSGNVSERQSIRATQQLDLHWFSGHL